LRLRRYHAYAILAQAVDDNKHICHLEISSVSIPAVQFREAGASIDLTAAMAKAQKMPTIKDFEAMIIGGCLVGTAIDKLDLTGAFIQVSRPYNPW
jgi:hypothetical protein